MSLSLRRGRFATSLRFRFRHASADRTATDNVIVEIRDSDGICGYGEGCPRQYVTDETAETAALFIDSQGPAIALAATTLANLRSWIAQNENLIDANPAAFAAIECAALDLIGKRAGQPLESVIGAPPLIDPVPYTAVISDSSPGKTRLIALAHRLWGFSDFKIKISGDPGRDRQRLQTLPPGARIRADANNHWQDAATAVTHIQGLGRPFWAIEEPVTAGDYSAMQTIAEALGLKIILDESLTHRAQLTCLAESPHLWVANIRVSKCGGILRASHLAKQAQALGIGVILGAHVGETSLLTRAALAVGQTLKAPPIAREGAYGTILLKSDLTQPALRFSHGCHFHPNRYGLNKAAGLGIKVNTDLIQWAI
ncbi:MAG: enolase C-terminal domain-like protein [Alphaproteobacteria bacterium]